MKGIFVTTFVASVIMLMHSVSADVDPSVVGIQKDCRSLIDHALCEKVFTLTEKWAWDPDTETCELFMRGECEGNNNAYKSEEECEKTCGPGKRKLHVKKKTRRSGSQLVNIVKELNQNLALKTFSATDNEANDKLQKANVRKDFTRMLLAPAWLWRTVQKTRPVKDSLAFKRNSLKREGEIVLTVKGLSRIGNLFSDTSVKEHRNTRHRPIADSLDNRLGHSDRLNQNECSSKPCWLHKSFIKSCIKASPNSKKATSSKDTVASDIYQLNRADRLTEVDRLNPINCFPIPCWLKKYRAKVRPSVYPTSLLSKDDFRYNRGTRLNEVDGLDYADRINYANRLRHFIPPKDTERSKQYRLHRFIQTESGTRSPTSLYNLINFIKLFNPDKLKQFDRTPNKKIIKPYLDSTTPIVRNPYQLDEIVTKNTVKFAGSLFSDEDERMDKPNDIAIPHKRGFKNLNFKMFLDRKYKPNANYTHFSPYFLMDDAFNMMDSLIIRIDTKNSSLLNTDADSATNTNSNKQQKRDKKFKTVIYPQLR